MWASPPTLRIAAWRRLRAALALLKFACAAFVDHLAATRQRAARRRAMHGLSDQALLDLGLRRCEIDSYWAESEGLAPVTRMRLARGRPCDRGLP